MGHQASLNNGIDPRTVLVSVGVGVLGKETAPDFSSAVSSKGNLNEQSYYTILCDDARQLHDVEKRRFTAGAVGDL